ncbi:hypothetical protein L1987_46058 [Smallanthus sonchifolius]|uniref:Uncharacterized protein n=1 Tax=Smallanthus sonchifolius TaxID=185202 RepID=A0ACB9FZP2_9ASTR|nr:hypothetical protein L1987_46058 [Smallanthus sonchifolius]
MKSLLDHQFFLSSTYMTESEFKELPDEDGLLFSVLFKSKNISHGVLGGFRLGAYTARFSGVAFISPTTLGVSFNKLAGKMLHDVVHPLDQPPLEQVSSPLSAQILEFCEPELFHIDAIQNSDVTSVSNCCYEEQSSYAENPSFVSDMIKYTMPASTVDNCEGNFTTNMFEEKLVESVISAPLDFTNLNQYSFSRQDQFDLCLLQNQISLATDDGPIPPYPHPNDPICENEFLSIPPSKYMRLHNPNSSPSHCFLDHPYLPSRNSNPILPVESYVLFNGNLSLTSEIQAHELDFHGDNDGIFYNSNELQALSNESRVNNGVGRCNPPLPPPEITSLESESFRVANKLTNEERKEKIHRYMKKRNERNFSKKIKYACRKTLADSRPRVRGRFAKNEEFGDHHRNNCNTHEEDTDEDVKSMHVVVKEEEKLDSSDIFAHISGLNSFRCNYPIQSWI